MGRLACRPGRLTLINTIQLFKAPVTLSVLLLTLTPVFPTFLLGKQPNTDKGFSIEVTEPNYSHQQSAHDLQRNTICGLRAIIFDSNGSIMDSARLRDCRFDGDRRIQGTSGIREHVSVELGFLHPLSRQDGAATAVADFHWGWIVASSSQSEAVQVFELSDHRLRIVQQIEFNVHHGWPRAGASFDPKTDLLTVRAVRNDPANGRCCPSILDVVAYRWSGNRFIEVH